MNTYTPFEIAKNSFNDALSRFSMLKGRKSVLVAFSGGADSTLLLTLLSEHKDVFVSAAHLNHGIRGDEADRDELFCRDFCKKLSIPFYSMKADVTAISKEMGIGLEEAARKVRYDFLDSIADENHFDCIATAHNADDNVETQIFRLVRGASLDGLCGIPPTRDKVIRPLIFLSKDSIIRALDDRGIPYVIDSTNLEDDYSRNLIRNKVICHLKKLNPSLTDTVSSSLETLKRDREFLNGVSSQYSFASGRTVLKTLHDAILSRVILNEASRLDISLESKHINIMMDAIRSDKVHDKISLPETFAVIDRNTVYFQADDIKKQFCIPLSEGINLINKESIIVVEATQHAHKNDIERLKNIYKLSIQAQISSAKINTDTVIRSRKNGDTIRQNGMTKKVKKLLQSLKMPSKYVNGIPFIETNGEIIYIPHFEPCDSARPKDGDEYCTVYYFTNR